MRLIGMCIPDKHIRRGSDDLIVRPVGDVIITPIDKISAQKCTNASWTAIRGAHKISKKTNQSTKGNTSGLIHRRLYADVAAAPA